MLHLSLYFSILYIYWSNSYRRAIAIHYCALSCCVTSVNCNPSARVIIGDEWENSEPNVVTFTPFLTMEPATLSSTGVVQRRGWRPSRMLAYVSSTWQGDGRLNAWKESAAEWRVCEICDDVVTIRRTQVRANIQEIKWMEETNGGTATDRKAQVQRRYSAVIFSWN